MPIVTATPRGLRNGEVITEFTDTTGITSVTYTYPAQQAGIMIENSGVSDILITVGGYINQVINPNKKWKANVTFTSFSIRSDANSQEFIATAFQNDIEGSGVEDSTARVLINDVKKQIKESSYQSNAGLPRIITLIGCQEDETPIPAGALNTVAADLVNFKVGDRGLKVNILGASGHQVDFNPDVAPLTLPPCSALCAWIYVEDTTKITSLTINFFLDAGLSIQPVFAASTGGGLVNGWNLLRWSTLYPTTPMNLTSIHRIRLTGGSSAATSYTIGHIWMEAPEKAQILFIQDGGTKSFYNNGYKDLKNRGIPVTWGLAAKRIGTAGYLNEAEIIQLAREGNAISFHSWDIEVTNTMTAAQIRADTMRCIKRLERLGFRPSWRSAWTQNLAPQHAAAQGLLTAYAMTAGGAGKLSCYPFLDRFSISRIAIHAYNADAAALPAFFSDLKKTNSLMVCYTHDISESDPNNITSARWAQFLSEIDKGISEGWLEGVTYETLTARSGIKHRQGYGDSVTEVFSKTGVYTNVRLP